jgi:hypothetical protein
VDKYIYKYQEAEFFLGKVKSETASFPHLKYYLSAFLSASRSVQQYIYKTVKDSPRHKSWYEQKSTQITRFMKDIRDVNIHVEPISPNGDMIAHVTPTNLKTNEPNGEGWIEIKFKFSNWLGTEEGLQLCEIYLADIKKIIDEGKQRGYI